MKRIDKFTKEEIIKQLAYSDETLCNYCIHQTLEGSCATLSCIDGVMEWFNQAIKTAPRIATINTAEELEKNFLEYHGTRNYSVRDFVDWLKEDIEVEE